jgi:S-DNA-T family DNA segregation ATPase FtsK/SpoIIIE
MSHIVIVVDEMSDMMMTAAKEVEAHIVRLAQKARAVGMHLIVATQKPTVDVITGLIKGNLPARIAFQVSSRGDSRVVLDEMGADKLLGNGDMLFLIPGTSHLVRAQGTYVGDAEIERVTEYLSRYPVQFSKELMQLKSGVLDGKDAAEKLKARDEMYEAAIEVIIREGRGSTSLLQKALGIGYQRASRLIDFMAEDGIVGEYKSGTFREVLYTLEEWEAFRNGDEAGEAA